MVPQLELARHITSSELAGVKYIDHEQPKEKDAPPVKLFQPWHAHVFLLEMNYINYLLYYYYYG